MKKHLIFCFLVMSALSAFAQESIDYDLCNQDFRPLYMRKGLPANAVYTNPKASAESRAADAVKRLTFDEKLMLTGGWNHMHLPAVPRLGLAPVTMSDASQGIHIKNWCVTPKKSTAFPCVLELAATWDEGLTYQYAKSISQECRAWGIDVLLGPGLNMYRNAEGGRNFEYMGEDPYLTSALGVDYVKGLQSQGTVATIKHFLGNEQELARHVINVQIGERALREIYLRPYETAIKKGGALAVMTGNNMVNGFPGAADKPLSGDILRKEFHFNGVIMSDWANSEYWEPRLNLELTSGHSLLMDNNTPFAAYIKKYVADHPEKKAEVEDQLGKMAFYNLYSFFKAGIYDRPYRDPKLVDKIDSHKAVALQTAEEGMTLLKNENHILPIKDNVKKIVIAGSDEALRVYGGKGSGLVEGYDHVDFLTALKAKYGDKILSGPSVTDADIKSADVVLFFSSKPAAEGSDVDFNKPMIGNDINKYAALNANIVVINSGGNGMSMPWLPKVKGLLFIYLSGQERGNALVNILSGKISPSGKLPFTIEKSFDDSPAKDYNKMSDGTYYWGGGHGNSTEVRKKYGDLNLPYTEGIYIGYRWYDKKNIEPQFPFGFGLSYTSFNYSPITAVSAKVTKLKPATISLTIKNTGPVDGAEVVQLYIHKDNSKINRPAKELKGFKRVFLKAGESKKISFTVDWHNLAYWNDKTHQWAVEPGSYTVEAASSSKDIRSQKNISF